MINVSIFVYGDDGLAKRLELFEDENISINSSIQNINDISKVFTDFSQSFTVPATKTNNAIFKHWYENSLDGGFNATKRKDAFIELDTATFRKGKIQLEKATYKQGDIDNYTLTFFGSLISLKDKFANRFLRDFDYSAYNFTYTGAVVKNRVAGGVTNDVKFPLISSNNVWQYDTNGTSQSNWDISKIATPISYLDLFPAMRISKILDSIATELGITFSGTFLSNPKFTNAFLWLKNTDRFVQNSFPNIIDFQSATSTVGTQGIFNVFTNTLNYVEPTLPIYLSSSNIELTFSVAGIEFVFSVYKDGVKINEQQYLTQTSLMTFTAPLNNTGAYTFYISSLVPVTFTGNYKLELRDGIGTITTDVNAIRATTQTTNSILDVAGYMPELKAEDFFSGLLKMFNLTCYSIDETTYEIEQLEEWYSAGETYDISEYCQTDEINLERVNPFKTINFSYQECENLLATAFLAQSDIPYGDLKYEVDNDGQEFSIELPFENMPFTKFANTNLQVGYSIKSDLSAYIPKPVILYDYGVVQTLTSPKTYYFDDGTSSATATTYNLFGQDTLVSAAVNTINWGAEQSSYTNFVETNSLFNNYYSAYLSNTFNQKARLMKIKAILPIFLLSKLALNDKIVIRDKRYIINSYQTELTTGETSLELMSDFRSIVLDTTTTTTTTTIPPTTIPPTTAPPTTAPPTTVPPTTAPPTPTTTAAPTTTATPTTYYKLDACSAGFGQLYTTIVPNLVSQRYIDSVTQVFYVWDNTTTTSPGTIGTNIQLVFAQQNCPTPTTTTTTTTTLPQVNFTITNNCSGGSGTVTIDAFSGGSGTYQASDTVYTSQVNAFIGNFVSATAPKNYLTVSDGLWWIAVRDANNTGNAIAKSIQVTCATTTAAPTTTTIQVVWYRLSACINGDTLFSQSYNIGTFNLNDRVTFGGAFFTIEEVRFNQPAGSLIPITATGLTGCPTTTAPPTTLPTTVPPTTSAPVFTYLRYDVNEVNCGTFNPIPFFAYTSYANGFYILNGDGILRYLQSQSHTNFSNQINSIVASSCTPATTTATPTTTAAPTTTCTPNGTLLSTFCSGFDLIGTYANGNCGTYNQPIEFNSPSCGYVAPTTVAPTTTATPTTAAPNCQQYFLSNSDEFSDFYSYQSCDGTQNSNVELQGGGSLTICARIGTVSAGGAITVDGPQGSCS